MLTLARLLSPSMVVVLSVLGGVRIGDGEWAIGLAMLMGAVGSLGLLCSAYTNKVSGRRLWRRNSERALSAS